jgi:hypothetical protein
MSVSEIRLGSRHVTTGGAAGLDLAEPCGHRIRHENRNIASAISTGILQASCWGSRRPPRRLGTYNTEQGHRGDEVAHQPASNFTTWPKPLLSTTYTLPAPSTATSLGLWWTVDGTAVWSFDPAANFTT